MRPKTGEAMQDEDTLRFELGLKTRKQVLGAAHVETALAKATEFSFPMQKLVTQICWDEIWN